MPTQSVVFLKPKWKLTEARKKFKSMGYTLYKNKKVDITKTSYRFRVDNPKKYKRFATKKLSNDILLILGF